MNSRKYLLVVGLPLFFACGHQSDCTKAEATADSLGVELTQRDSVLDVIGETFMVIDSNSHELRTVEYELLQEVSMHGRKNNEIINEKVDRIKGITQQNQELVNQLQISLKLGDKYSTLFSGLLTSLQDRMNINNVRLSKLNQDLGTLGKDFRNLFDEYVNAEAARWILEEDMERMQGSMQEMEGSMAMMNAQMQHMKNQLNTCYITMGTKKELIDAGVLEKGGILKGDQINGNTNLMAFKPYDLNELDKIEIASAKCKLITRHPTNSYKIGTEEGITYLYIESEKDFWSLSKYLIVQEP